MLCLPLFRVEILQKLVKGISAHCLSEHYDVRHTTECDVKLQREQFLKFYADSEKI